MDQEEQLYVLDVYLNKIKFAPCIIDIPRKEDIDVSVSFKNFVNMNIGCKNSTATSCTADTCLLKDDLYLHFGKSQVFFSDAINLQLAMKKLPLKLLLNIQCNYELFGEAKLAWTLDFIGMVNRSKRFRNDVRPVSIERIQDIISSENGQVVGQIDMFIKLSCFGHITIEQFQEMPRHSIAVAVQPPQMKNLFQHDDTFFRTFVIGLISFTIFIIALYPAM